MSAFEHSKHFEEGAFELESIESKEGERGEFTHEITLPEGLDGFAVLIEGQAIGEGESFYVAMDIGEERVIAPGLAQMQKNNYGAYLHTERQPDSGKTIKFNVFVTAGANLKVSVLKVFRRAKGYALSKLSCEGCKRLLRFVVSAILVQFGVVLTPDDFLPINLLPEEWKETLLNTVGAYRSLPEPLREFLDFVASLFKGGLVDILRAMSDILKEAFKPLDAGLSLACTQMGFCVDK